MWHVCCVRKGQAVLETKGHRWRLYGASWSLRSLDQSILSHHYLADVPREFVSPAYTMSTIQYIYFDLYIPITLPLVIVQVELPLIQSVFQLPPHPPFFSNIKTYGGVEVRWPMCPSCVRRPFNSPIWLTLRRSWGGSCQRRIFSEASNERQSKYIQR